MNKMADFNKKISVPLKDLNGLTKFIVDTSDREYISLDEFKGDAFELRKVVSVMACTTTYLHEDTQVNVIGYI